MATNINLSYPNFTLTPQAGTFGTINTDEATTRLRIKNTSGGLVNDFTLSANIHPDNELIGIEYCGPLNLTEIIDNVTASVCPFKSLSAIKSWARPSISLRSSSELDLSKSS